LVNINTDGVAFIPHSDDYIRVWKDWEKEFNLTLEEDEFDIFIQRDVNNYVAKKGDIVVCKGGDVNRYSEDAIFRNNNARILDIALVDDRKSTRLNYSHVSISYAIFFLTI